MASRTWDVTGIEPFTVWWGGMRSKQAEVAKARQQAEELEKRREEDLTQAANNVAAIEDRLQQEDGRHEANHLADKDNGQVSSNKEDAARKKRTSVDDDEQSDDGNFRYGGIVPDDETDEIEARAVKDKMVKKPEDDKITVIKPNPLMPKKSSKFAKAPNTDAWDPEVTPHLRLKAGNSADPWNFPRMSEVQDIIDEVYGKEKYKIVETGAFYGLAQVRAQNWCRSFFEGAKKTIAELVQQHKAKLNPGETICDFIEYYQLKTTDGETCVYQWKSVNPVTLKKKGFLAADMIMKTLGLAHMAKLPQVLCDFGAERPIGALVLATQAARFWFINTIYDSHILHTQIDHILEQWKMGEFVTSNKEFSTVNYANKEVFATPVMDPVQKWKTVKKIAHRSSTLTFQFTSSLLHCSSFRCPLLMHTGHRPFAYHAYCIQV
ncbi:hypothetical protein JOM56_011702 [Amanita muscaria]